VTEHPVVDEPAAAPGRKAASGGAYAFAEDIRLIIWDLDETFWRGTLTEGGVDLPAAHVQIVRSLAARGIISALCSKNDPAPVRDILLAHGVWNDFVFPDISWSPKGPRVQALIEQAQLRAASVLFIDDNPTNRAEVTRFTPGVNVADEGVIPRLLAHPRLAGKPDPHMTRLQQYRQLQARWEAHQAAASDPSDFLRASNITVSLEYDVAAHMPRVIELINRTNQLNFCKSRVAEDPQIATASLLPLIEAHNTQCALVRVQDAYGDHGFCGFYICNTDLRRLQQFCFSCRILGLGVEQWVYEKLGRPALKITGEVLSDPDTPRHVDWINQASGARGECGALAILPCAVTVRGGCELGAVMHYFRTASGDVAGEYPFVRNGANIRLDHTVILHQALQGLSPAQRAVAAKLGFEAGDFETRIFDAFPDGHAVVLSFGIDTGSTLFRHKASGFIAPWDNVHAVLSSQTPPDLGAGARSTQGLSGDDFESLGLIGRTDFKAHLREFLAKMPASTHVFILCGYEAEIRVGAAAVSPPNRLILVNRWTRQVARGHPRVCLLRMEDYADGDEALGDHFHFRRLAYHRVFSALYAALATGDFTPFNRKPPPRAALRSAWAALKSASTIDRLRTGLRRLLGRPRHLQGDQRP
jgi:FkbH-like protein